MFKGISVCFSLLILLALQGSASSQSDGNESRPDWEALGKQAQLFPPSSSILLPRSSIWSYLDDGSDAGTDWREPDFDDSGWAQGPAQFGYGDGDEDTIVSFGPAVGTKYTTTYFRTRFDLDERTLYSTLALKVLRDDGMLCYLNGKLLKQSNMPSGTIDFQTFAASSVASAEERTFVPYAVDESLLVEGENVLAVEIHQRSPQSSDISFDLELVASSAPLVFRGPYLQSGGPNEVTLRWRTSSRHVGRVWTWNALVGFQTIDEASPSFDHVVQLRELYSQGTYFYAVGVGQQMLVGATSDFKFRTSPRMGEAKPFRAWVLGDSGSASNAARSVRDAYISHSAEKETDLVLLLGDNAYNVGSDVQYQGALFDFYAEQMQRCVFWPTRGNHETSVGVYQSVFDTPTGGEFGGVSSGTEAYYSFDYANVHFICLDSFGSDRSAGGAMWTWLESDLLSTNQDWLIAFWHHPPYSKGSHDSDTESHLIEMRQNFVPLLEDHGVDLVLSGHSHAFERSFLVNGHHGLSGSLIPSMILNDGDGQPGSDGPYVKRERSQDGTVYCVTGSAGLISSKGNLDHPVMQHSARSLGSVILDVDGEVLDLTFLDDKGIVDDHFRLLKFPDGGLTANRVDLSASAGGTQILNLDAGSAAAGQLFWLLGSRSGTSPGFALGNLLIPLNMDSWFYYTAQNPNQAPLVNSKGSLDSLGRSQVMLQLMATPDLTLVGQEFQHAFLLFQGQQNLPVSVSNPVRMSIGP